QRFLRLICHPRDEGHREDLTGMASQRSLRRCWARALAAIGAVTAIVGALLIGVAVVAAPVAAVVPPPDTCDYPTRSGASATAFLESTVMRAVQVIGSGTSAKVAGWANDEKGRVLGISDTTAAATSFAPDPATGTQYYNHV